MDIMPYVDLMVPTPLADVLVAACEATGLKWGVLSRNEYFFQPPKLHIFLLVAALGVAALLWQQSRKFRKECITTFGVGAAGWSTKCPINTAIGYLLLGCFASQVYAKATRPKPFVQLGWLLMPCHMITLAWASIMLRQKPQQYGSNCYLASLLIAWAWNPIGALASPDWGDHQFAFEGQIFMVHHALLVLLPLYYAARYHVEPLSRRFIYHFTWVPLVLNFGIKTPAAMLFGLNVDYMLSPPPVKALPPIFHSVYYRAAFVLLFVPLACVCTVVYGALGQGLAKAVKTVNKAKKKLS